MTGVCTPAGTSSSFSPDCSVIPRSGVDTPVLGVDAPLVLPTLIGVAGAEGVDVEVVACACAWACAAAAATRALCSEFWFDPGAVTGVDPEAAGPCACLADWI